EAGQPIGAAAVLRRGLPGGLALNYAPRGPILDGHLEQWPTFWQALRERLAQDGGTVLKVDPEWTTDAERAALTESGALPSRHPIQHQATMLVDIRGGDQALMRLKESTRRTSSPVTCCTGGQSKTPSNEAAPPMTCGECRSTRNPASAVMAITSSSPASMGGWCASSASTTCRSIAPPR